MEIILLMLAGLIFMMYIYIKIKREQETWNQAEGNIIRMKKGDSTVEFQVDEKKYTYKRNKRKSDYKGKKEEILFNPDNPHDNMPVGKNNAVMGMIFYAVESIS